MPRVRYREKEVDTLGRLLRAEAGGEGKTGMLLVGNVVINRVKARCQTFKNINTIEAAIFQKGQFEGTKISLFNARATTTEKNLALKAINSWRQDPAYNALFSKIQVKANHAKIDSGVLFQGDIKTTAFIIRTT